MNNQLSKVFVFTLSIFLFFACKNECSHVENFNQKIDSSSCYPNSERPPQAITYKEMASMMDAYNNGAKKVLNEYMKQISAGKDTVSTDYNWYRIDDLKQYIAYIERISKEKEIKVTGFRIYPSSYPNNYSIEELKGRLTLIFTPTTTINGKEDVAFEPLYSEKGKPVEITQFLERAKTKYVNKGAIFSFSNMEDDEDSSSANRMNPTPPY